MAFSTTSDHSQTGTQIMTEAMELLGVLEAGGTISTNDSTSVLRTLNNLIKLWSADTQIFAQGEYTLDLTASDGTYTLDTGNVGYIPEKVISATIIDSTGLEIPLSPLTKEEWSALTNKTSTGTPTQYWQQRHVSGVGLDFFLWPEPVDTTYDAKLWLQYKVRDVDAVGDDVWFAQEWYMALSYGLAYYIAPKFGISIQERRYLGTMAEDLRWEASTYDVDGSVFIQPDTERS